MGKLPSGIVTFVLTDVVSSTRLWQDAADQMDGAIARHVELIAAATGRHGGAILKARGEGDSTFCVFGRASDAVAAAHDAQLALRAEPWPESAALMVRFALHTGEAVERGGDFLGPVVNRAARLRSIARGGEVLLSGTTASLVVDGLPDGVRLVELGDVQLRDLDRAEHVYALDAAGLEVPPRGDSRQSFAGPPAIDVRLLGPVNVLIEGDPVDIGGPKERTVLSLLALAGGPVTHERLMDDLWDCSPPASARKTVQTYVWRLRRVLTDEVLASVAAGYELRLVVDTDVARFERLMREAMEWRERDDASHAADLLEEALGLWRGDALAGCAPSLAVEAHRARLHELRAGAIDRRFDCELLLGRHTEVIGDLEHLVQEDPFREERWRMLVIALYRSGRQADALRSVQRARATLIEGLGVELGSALKSLEQAVLDQRPELDAPRAQGTRRSPEQSPGASPVTLPPTPATPLIGRAAEQDALVSLVGIHRLVTLTGVGGAGKTRLALAVAERHQDGLVAFCDLSSLSRDGSVLHALAQSVGAPTERHLAARVQPDLLQGVLDDLRSRELLIVIDNCEHVLEPCSEIVSRVLAECRDISVVATSREPLGVPGEHVVPVPPLDVPTTDDDVAAGSVQLFAQRGAAARSGFTVTDSNRSSVIEICRRLEGLPLALELAAARLSHVTPDELVARLDQPLQLLTTRQRTGPERHRTIQAMLEWSHDLLDAPEQTVFRRLGVFAGWFGLRDVEACCMTGLGGTDALDLLRGLVDCSLVVPDSTDATSRYRMLDTIRSYGRALLAASAEEDEVRAAHCDWYLTRIESVPLGTRLLAMSTTGMMGDVHEDLRRALLWADSTERHDLVARLVVSMIGPWKEGHFAEADRWFPVAVEYEASLPPSERTATALSSLMYLFRWDGDHDALRRHQLRLAALVENFRPDHPMTSLAYSTLASLCSRLHGEESAWEAYADLALRHAPPDSPPLQAMARCQKARALMFRSEHEEAIAVLEEGAAMLGSGADSFQFSPEEDLALAHHLIGNYDRALGLAESRWSTRDKPALGWYVAIYAGLSAAALGDKAGARRYLRDAAERDRALSMPLAVNDCRMMVGAMAFLEGRPSRAVELLAGLPTGSTSFNTLGVLLRHYQALARQAVSVEDWEAAQTTGTDLDAWPLIQAELSLDDASGH